MNKSKLMIMKLRNGQCIELKKSLREKLLGLFWRIRNDILFNIINYCCNYCV